MFSKSPKIHKLIMRKPLKKNIFNNNNNNDKYLKQQNENI